MVKYLSGRQKLRPSDKLTEDRYQYLGLDQAEPNLADPATSPGVPSGLQYQLVAVTGYEGRRYWVPVGGSLQPGAITVFDEGTPVSSASSITQMNFVGAAVTAQVSLQNPSGHPGIAATVTVIPVNVGDSPPNTPTPNEGELWWESDTGDLYIYYNDGSSAQWVMANAGGRGITGDKGETGDKGQKGEVGLTGAQGAKGQKGEIGIGQKGEVGDKGQKGEIGVGSKGDKGAPGADGNDGSDGDKGQKGELGTKGDKGDGSAGGASVTISDNAPSSPNNGDLWWESDTFDLHVYYQDGTSNQWVSITSNAALKGEKGDKGQKGEVGDKGQKGEIGTKGDKGEIGSTGGTGGTGAKGQKGEIGATGAAGSAAAKGQKGEVGSTGGTGSAGDKGSTGDKGDKGAPSTVAGDKGQKGEIGTAGDKGATGAGDKGQKGEEGPQGGGAPVGQIVAWSGSAGSLPSGYFLCDGSAISRSTYAALFSIVGTTHGSGNGSSTFNIPDLRDRFVVGASNSTGDTTYPGVSPGATGGSANAVLVSHTHNLQNHVHGVNLTSNNPGDHDHNVDVLAEFASTHGTWQTGGGYRQVHTGGTHRKPITSDAGGHTHTVSGNTGTPSTNTTDTLGESATNKNLPPYYSLAYIIQYAQGGSTAKGQKGEQGATGSGGSTGDKGQKGEAGDKGAASSVQGPAGDKGQKGEVGAQGSGGSAGSDGAKGQKGELGADGGSGADGSDGDKGQKGEVGAGQKGQKGDDNSTKGQKGEVGSITAAIPSGGIIIWSGASNAIPSGWYLCNGQNSTPDLRNRFIVGAGSGYSVGNTGGSADATLVSHSHSVRIGQSEDAGDRTLAYHDDSSGYTNETGLVNSNGSSATNANLPPYYALCYIMKS